MTERKAGETKISSSYRVQIAGERQAVHLACSAIERPARIALLQSVVERMRPIVSAEQLFATVRRLAAAINGDDVRAILSGVDLICSGKVRPAAPLELRAADLHPMMPFGALFVAWNSGRLAELFPGYVRPVKTSKDQAYIYGKHAKRVVHEVRSLG